MRQEKVCTAYAISPNKLCHIELLPASLSVARVVLAQGEEFDAIGERMELLCEELGTRFFRADDSLVWQAAQHH